MVATRTSTAWGRYVWVAGILFVVALVAESVIATGLGLSQDDSAAKVAGALHLHRQRLVVITYLSILYASMFLIYLCSLYDLLRGDNNRSRMLGSLVLVGGLLFVGLHAVSDIGVTGLLGAKLTLAGYQPAHDVAYTLYLLTYALDSVGDVFGSLFALATGMLVIRGKRPAGLAWLGLDPRRDHDVLSRLRARRRHLVVRAGSGPYRVRTLPGFRTREQSHLADARKRHRKHRRSE